MDFLAQLLPLLIGGATAAGDTFAQFGANASQEGLFNRALGLNASTGQWGHEQLNRNAGLQNLGVQNLLSGANSLFWGAPAAGPSQLGLPGAMPRTDRRWGRAPIETANRAGAPPSGAPGLTGGGLVGALNRGFTDLRSRSLADLAGVGRQERRDINTQYNTLASQQRGDATRRGFASSTVLGGMRRGVERERADALGRLDERLARERIGLDTTLTGNMLSNLWNTNTGALGQTNALANAALGTMDTGNMRTFDFGRENIGNLINLLASRNDVYQQTDPNTYSQLFAGAAPAPQYPTDNSGLFSGLLGAGTTLGATGILAGAGGAGGASGLATWGLPLAITSDRNAKQNFDDIDSNVMLDRIRALSVSEWEYKSHPGVRHMGPMAQDFRHVFRLGDNETYIYGVDAMGVSIAAVKALLTKVDAMEAEIAELKGG